VRICRQRDRCDDRAQIRRASSVSAALGRPPQADSLNGRNQGGGSRCASSQDRWDSATSRHSVPGLRPCGARNADAECKGTISSAPAGVDAVDPFFCPVCQTSLLAYPSCVQRGRVVASGASRRVGSASWQEKPNRSPRYAAVPPPRGGEGCSKLPSRTHLLRHKKYTHRPVVACRHSAAGTIRSSLHVEVVLRSTGIPVW